VLCVNRKQLFRDSPNLSESGLFLYAKPEYLSNKYCTYRIKLIHVDNYAFKVKCNINEAKLLKSKTMSL